MALRDKKELELQLKTGDRATLTDLEKLLNFQISEARERNDTAHERDFLLNQGEIKGYKKLLDCIKIA